MLPDHTKILQVLYENAANEPLSALSREDLIQKTNMSWEEIRKEAIYLQGKQQIVMRSRQLGNRILYSLYITPEGTDFIEKMLYKPAIEPAPAPPSPAESLQLTLRIVPRGKRAQITWEAVEIGHTSSSFRMPYDAATLPLVIKALDAIQWSTHPLGGPQFDRPERDRLAALGLWSNDRLPPDIHQRVGRALYDALVASPNGRTALNSVRNMATAQGLPISYLLRFPADAIDLAALPWELLWEKNGPLLLSRGKLAPCVRYLDLEQALPPPWASRSSLRILAITPNARIAAAIRDEERTARVTAWAGLGKDGVVQLEELNPATPSGLVDRIQSGPPVDIIHFYGHGRYKDGQGALLFDAPDGGETWQYADQLAALLGGARLIVLHACQSAMIGAPGLLTGVAPALSAAGVPAVVAMQLTVRVEAATRFAGVVYRSLARGDSIQQAVGQARQALYFEEDDGASWYVPTLTIRARDTGPLRLVIHV
jgi:hypothetical protein